MQTQTAAPQDVRPGRARLGLSGLLTAASIAAVTSLAPIATAGASVPTCDGLAATLVASPAGAAVTVVTGTEADDVIVGTPGDDDIDGRGGNDVICAGTGADLLIGGPGNDRLFGEGDGLVNISGWDELSGDRLVPGPGDDHLDVGLDQRAARAWVDPWDPESATAPARPWSDALDFSTATAGISLDLSAANGIGTVTGDGLDTVALTSAPVELAGTRFADTFVGSPSSDVVNLGAGDDRAEGRAGGDRLTMGTGTDWADGGSGGDFIFLEPDNSGQTNPPGVGASETALGGTGVDDLDAGSAGATLIGGMHRDSMRAAPTNQPISLEGGHGEDTYTLELTGPIPGGVVREVKGDDEDTLEVSLPDRPGVATLSARTGRLTVDSAGWLRFSGLTSFYLQGGRRWLFRGTGAAEVLDMTDGGDAQSLRAHMGAGRDTVIGSNRRDVIDLGAGDDWTSGRRGSDTLVGGLGNDRLIGGAGRDTGSGGGGRDRCTSIERGRC